MFTCCVTKSRNANVPPDYGLINVDINTLERGPNFEVLPYSTVVVGKPNIIEVECVASGNPEPVYSWWKGDDYKYTARVTSKLDHRYTITNGKLTIHVSY